MYAGSGSSIVHSSIEKSPSQINSVWKSIICNRLLSKHTSSDMPMQHTDAHMNISKSTLGVIDFPWLSKRMWMTKPCNIWQTKGTRRHNIHTETKSSKCTNLITEPFQDKHTHTSIYTSLSYLLEQPLCQGSHDFGLDPSGPLRRCAWLLWLACWIDESSITVIMSNILWLAFTLASMSFPKRKEYWVNRWWDRIY